MSTDQKVEAYELAIINDGPLRDAPANRRGSSQLIFFLEQSISCQLCALSNKMSLRPFKVHNKANNLWNARQILPMWKVQSMKVSMKSVQLHMLCIGSSQNEDHLNFVSYVLIWGSREVLVLVTASTADILTWGTTFWNPLGGHKCLHLFWVLKYLFSTQ